MTSINPKDQKNDQKNILGQKNFQNQIQPNVDCQVIAQKGEKLQIPDRSLQLSQQQINLFIRRDNVIDANTNPQLVREYIEPPADYFKKIAFGICQIIVLVFYIPKQGYTQQQKAFNISVMKKYYIISSITIIINLIYYFLIKPPRIMEHADNFLLINVRKTNSCLNFVIGYLISDFGIIMTFIAFIFLIINSVNICRQKLQQKKRREAYDSKANKLIINNQSVQYSELIQESAVSKKQTNDGFHQVEMK